MTTIPAEDYDHESDKRLISLMIAYFKSLGYKVMVKNLLNEIFFVQKFDYENFIISDYEISIFQLKYFKSTIQLCSA